MRLTVCRFSRPGDPAAGKWALADEVERIVDSHVVAGPVEFAADPALA